MKKCLFFFLIILSNSLFSQFDKKILDANEVSALFYSDGSLFQNKAAGTGNYIIPKESGLKSFFAAGIWIAGKDENDILRVAALRYGNGRDFYPGTYSYNDITYPWLDYEKEIWKVSKEQIACHISNYNNPYYQIPEDILTWPAHRDSSIGGFSENLAPFIDINNDGIYSPLTGEYPLIIGDEALYYIMNDYEGPHTETGGLPLGIEVHVMAYQYKETNSFLDSTTFIKYNILNKGLHIFDSLRIAFWADTDIGNYADDYIGSDPSRNMIFAYNGDLNDQSDGGQQGYGIDPPAAGVLSLSHNMDYSGYFTSTTAYPYNDPGPAAEYYNFMLGKWANGSDRLYGGLGYASSSGASTVLSDHCFPGMFDPDGTLSTNGIDMSGLFPNGWDETTNNNPTGDRRGYSVSNSFSFYPGDRKNIDYAILFGRSSNGTVFSSVERLAQIADSCQEFYNSNTINQLLLVTSDTDVNNYPACSTSFTPPPPPPLASNLGPKIRRLDGYGNGNNSLELITASKDSILQNGFHSLIEYTENNGPINVEIFDSSSYQPGYYKLDFIDYTAPFNGNSADTAKWILYHTNNNITQSFTGEQNILTDTVYTIPQLGLKLKVHQKKYFFPAGQNSNQYKTTEMINAEIIFGNNIEWLTGIKDNDSFYPTNWIRSGEYQDTTSTFVLPWQQPIPDYLNAPNYIDQLSADPEGNFENILDGIIAPHRLVGYQASYMPLAYVGSYSSTFKTNASISFLPSVDIVITSDQSKWTRCPVIELCRSQTLSVDSAKAGYMRKSQSVNKNGSADGSGTGMGWFPGYAIDLESGARLYMAFGENSFLGAENGADMLWNPTDHLVSNSGAPLMGGQHPIYIFSYKQKTINGFNQGFDFPAYIPSEAEAAGTNFLQNKWTEVETNSTTTQIRRELYGSLSWIMNPLLNQGHSILESDATIKLRINKEYKNFVASGSNQGKPSYDWFNTSNLNIEELTQEYKSLLIYPNPTFSSITIQGKEYMSQNFKIFDQMGREVLYGKLNGISTEVNMSKLSKGIYTLKIEGNYKPVKIVKE